MKLVKQASYLAIFATGYWYSAIAIPLLAPQWLWFLTPLMGLAALGTTGMLIATFFGWDVDPDI